MIPAYLKPGVSVRFYTIQVEEDGVVEKTLGTFNGLNAAKIWYFKSGAEVHIAVECDDAKIQKGVVTVLVYGKLCKEDHEEVKDVSR